MHEFWKCKISSDKNSLKWANTSVLTKNNSFLDAFSSRFLWRGRSLRVHAGRIRIHLLYTCNYLILRWNYELILSLLSTFPPAQLRTLICHWVVIFILVRKSGQRIWHHLHIVGHFEWATDLTLIHRLIVHQFSVLLVIVTINFLIIVYLCFILFLSFTFFTMSKWHYVKVLDAKLSRIWWRYQHMFIILTTN